MRKLFVGRACYLFDSRKNFGIAQWFSLIEWQRRCERFLEDKCCKVSWRRSKNKNSENSISFNTCYNGMCIDGNRKLIA